MKRMILAAGLAAACATGWAQQVGVSVSVNQPGVYGRIDIGHVPQPPVVVYQQPVVIAPTPVAVYQQPIYLHVPPGHAKDWRKHCGMYNACGQPVYFVQETWYQQHYVPAYRQDRDRDDDHDHGKHGKGHGKKHKHDD
ncbi:MAG TPA: hypothetical protein VF169_02335 [Albitalea sp.]|uniref:hypothetical protein n=1 Tax=Piscinibacter sp. TaxID=1903157 RepID=UPI002ED07A1F